MEKEDNVHSELKGYSFGQNPKRSNTIPPDYFDQLPDRIMSRWEREKTGTPVKKITLKQMIACAAVVAGICFGVVWFTNESTQLYTSSDITSAEAYQYILENINEFAPLMHETEQWAEEIKTDIPTDSGIEEYLIEELDGDQLETIF